MSKNTFPDFEITRIGHLRAEIQQIIEIWWPFWIMQIKCFPILGFLRTFSMVFWGPHRNSLWQKKLCCNLFQVKPYYAWTMEPHNSIFAKIRGARFAPPMGAMPPPTLCCHCFGGYITYLLPLQWYSRHLDSIVWCFWQTRHMSVMSFICWRYH